MSFGPYQEQIKTSQTLEQLEGLRVALLGKSGLLTGELKKLGTLSPEERKTQGAALNAQRDELTALIEAKRAELTKAAMHARLEQETMDVSLPARTSPVGRIHLIAQTIQDIKNYFTAQGFFVAEGPEVDDEFHNFDALNIPPHHPARQSHDTFYLEGAPGHLLRTHTSNVQIRTLHKQKPPLRCISLGRVYRSDDLDATHTPMFHQVEGLVLEPGIHFGHLKGCITDFCRWFFGVENMPVRFRPSFFPFTEPSAEVDIACGRKDGKLVIGEGSGWLEMLGCGMVHPHVLENCGTDPATTQGFAFGMGIERLIMVKYGITDIRQLYETDLRWLNLASEGPWY